MMTNEQYLRYSRHILLPEIGINGQEKITKAKVLVVGVGGLGCPAALYLAAAGVGTIGLVDDDRISLHNLQRQILYTNQDVGSRKTEIAADKLQSLNQNISVKIYPEKLTCKNATLIFKEFDFVIDGTDNFATRYLVNDACILLGKINIYGSVYRWEGSVTIFGFKGGPCYRCLFPKPPPPGKIQNCAEGGVLGVLPGVIGLLQATETIKVILGIETSLVGRFLTFDALSMKWSEIRLGKNKNCPICSETPSIKGLKECYQLCGTEGIKKIMESSDHSINEIPVSELETLIKDCDNDYLILDVREVFEYEIARIAGATHIPLNTLPQRVNEILEYREKAVMVYCHHGTRSRYAVEYLRRIGFTSARNVVGGIDAWSVNVDQNVTRY